MEIYVPRLGLGMRFDVWCVVEFEKVAVLHLAQLYIDSNKFYEVWLCVAGEIAGYVQDQFAQERRNGMIDTWCLKNIKCVCLAKTMDTDRISDFKSGLRTVVRKNVTFTQPGLHDAVYHFEKACVGTGAEGVGAPAPAKTGPGGARGRKAGERDGGRGSGGGPGWRTEQMGAG